MNKRLASKLEKQLHEELAKAEKELAFLEESVEHREHAENIVDELDEDFDANEKELLGDQQTAMWMKRKHNIQLSLEKIKKGTYGVCDDCGDTIKNQRMEAIPYAIYCIECEEKHEASNQHESY